MSEGTPVPRIAVLGQMRIEDSDGRLRDITATTANFVGALVTAPGHFLSLAGLAQDVWPDRAPQHPKAAMQTLVSRLRTQVAAGLVRSTPGGYGIDLGGGAIDLDLAGDLLAEARAELRAGAAHAAERLCDEADALWYGEPGTGLANPALAAEIHGRAVTLRAEIARLRAEAMLSAGRATEAVATLSDLTRDAPYDDHLQLLLLRALAGAGRGNDAVDAYARFRSRLADELGTDPAPEVAAFHEALLRQEDPLSLTGPRRVGLRADADILFGREADIAAVVDLLHTARLVTVTGTGGLGKTRLAQAVAARVGQQVPAVVVVELAGARSAEDVARALTDALGVPSSGAGAVGAGAGAPEQVPEPARAAVVEALAEHATLLVLDNCEQVAGPVGAWAAAILTAVATTRVLTTSRTPLRLVAEHVHELGPLPVRDAAGNPGPAVEMFRARAAAVRPGLVLDAELVRRLSERLEGIPLGIELAAARVRSLTVAEIEAALDDRFALLRSTDPAATTRHRALRDVVEWSWALLSERQQRLCRRAAVFPDGFDARAAAFLAPGPRMDVLDDLDALVAHSLVRAEEDVTTGAMRYRMFETIREFAWERAGGADDLDAAHAGAAAWCRDLAATSLTGPTGPAQAATFHRAATERENLRAVLSVARAAGDADTVIAAGVVLALLPLTRFDFADVDAVVRAVTEATRGHRTPPELAAAHLWFRIVAVGYQFVFGTVRDKAVALIELRRTYRDDPRPGPAADAFARVMLACPDAGRFAAEVAACTSSPDPGARRLGLLLSTYFAENTGALHDAEAAARAAHQIATNEQDTWTAAWAAQTLAGIHAQDRAPAETITWATRAATGFAALGIDTPFAPLARYVACAHLLAGDLDEAEAAFAAFCDADHPAADGELFGRAGLAEVALARVGGDATGRRTAGAEEILTQYRAALAGADWARFDTIMWRLLFASSCVAQHVWAGVDDPELATLAQRLCTHVVAVYRTHPQSADGPLLGAIAGVMALWATRRDAPGDRERAAALLQAMDALRSRQDLPALDRDRIRDAVNAAPGPTPTPGPDPDPERVGTEADGAARLLGLLEALGTAR